MARHKDCSPAKNADRDRKVCFAVITVILSVLIMANMALIYFFSSEDRRDSGDRSGRITRAVIGLLYDDFESLPLDEQESILASVGHVIRKLAHFSEFASLGLLTAALLCHISRRRRIRLWLCALLPAGFCLLYAISDEVHQIFTNRGPAVTDVLIDFAGSLFGIAVLFFAVSLAACLRRRRRRSKIQKGKETAS